MNHRYPSCSCSAKRRSRTSTPTHAHPRVGDAAQASRCARQSRHTLRTDPRITGRARPRQPRRHPGFALRCSSTPSKSREDAPAKPAPRRRAPHLARALQCTSTRRRRRPPSRPLSPSFHSLSRSFHSSCRSPPRPAANTHPRDGAGRGSSCAQQGAENAALLSPTTTTATPTPRSRLPPARRLLQTNRRRFEKNIALPTRVARPRPKPHRFGRGFFVSTLRAASRAASAARALVRSRGCEMAIIEVKE